MVAELADQLALFHACSMADQEREGQQALCFFLNHTRSHALNFGGGVPCPYADGDKGLIPTSLPPVDVRSLQGLIGIRHPLKDKGLLDI